MQQQLETVKLYASTVGDFYGDKAGSGRGSNAHGAGEKPRPERLILPTMGIPKPVKKKKRRTYAYQD